MGCELLDDEAITAIAHNCSNLESFLFGDSNKISNSIIEIVKNCLKLKELIFYRVMKINDSIMMKVA